MSERTLIDELEDRVAATGDQPAMHVRAGNGWTDVSWAALLHAARLHAAGLIEGGIGPGEEVIIYADNSPDWVVAELSILLAGAVSVPVYGHTLPRQFRDLTRRVRASAIFVAGESTIPCVAEVAAEQRTRLVIVMEGGAELSSPGEGGECDAARWCAMAELQERGARYLRDHPDCLAMRRRRVAADTLATIAFSSGTTGRPRAAMLTHAQLLSQVRDSGLALPLSPSDRQVILLPLAHVHARLLYLGSIVVGSSFAVVSTLDAWLGACRVLRPTFLAAVPAILELLHAEAHAALSEKGVRARVARGSVNDARHRALSGDGIRGPDPLALLRNGLESRLLHAPLRRRLGGRVRLLICGGGPVSRAIRHFFRKAGMPVIPAYGLTEFAATVALGEPGGPIDDAVGVVLATVDVRISSDGEIQLRGPACMSTYLDDGDGSSPTSLDGGWLHTGDAGAFDGGRLQVKGRLTDALSLEAGRRLYPLALEAELRSSPWIREVMIVSDGHRLGALLTLNRAMVSELASTSGWKVRASEALHEHPYVFNLIRDEIEALSRVHVPGIDLSRFVIIDEEFGLRNGAITPTFKLRRHFLRARYAELITELFRD